MPFVCKQLNRIVKAAAHIIPCKFSLLVQKTIYRRYRHRVSAFTSERGSATVEAAIVIPIFISVMFILLHLIVTINLQNNFSRNLCNASESIGKNIYMYEKSNISGMLTEAEVISEIYSNEFRKYLNRSIIINGVNGINYLGNNTDYVTNDGVLIKADYKIKYPYIPGGVKSIKYSQAVFFKPWVGESISDSANTSRKIVYVAEKGKVYHTNRNCTHLKLSVKETTEDSIKLLRNKYGEKYKGCELCADIETGKHCSLYITEEGNRYHIRKNCSGLKRTVYEVEIDKVGDRTLCLRCAK